MPAKPTPIEPAQIAATLDKLSDEAHGPRDRWDAPFIAAELAGLIEDVIAAPDDSERRLAAALLASWAHDVGWVRGVGAAGSVISGVLPLDEFAIH